jgi:hypothetical protein
MQHPPRKTSSIQIPLADGGTAIVDAQDEELVRSLGPWYRAEIHVNNEWTPAAFNSKPLKGERAYSWTWLHNLVMNAADKHLAPSIRWEVYPANGSWLDCRRSNLRIRPKRRGRA